jgi:hypothetical protein
MTIRQIYDNPYGELDEWKHLPRTREDSEAACKSTDSPDGLARKIPDRSNLKDFEQALGSMGNQLLPSCDPRRST